jgi:hypothetical protein
MRVDDLLTTSTFTRDEISARLGFPAKAIDALIASGTLRGNGDGTIEATQLEALFRDGLMRLYQATATRTPIADEQSTEVAPIAAPAPPADELEESVTRSIADYVEPPREKTNLRIAPRYTPRRQLGGTFRQTRFVVLQISTTGIRIRHDETVRPGDEAKLTISLLRPARTFILRARVVWTSIAQRGEEASFCISGLRVTAGYDQLHSAIDILRDARELEGEETAATRARPASPPPLRGVSDDDVASIIRAVRRLNEDPVEANRWYTRAKFAMSEPAVREAAPARARDREEVLGVWEYLERRIDIKSVTGVMAWLRRTREATAVA